MTLPKEFFTLQSMLTLTGATGMVYVVCNGLQTALNFNPKWLALAVAQVIALLGVQQSGGVGIDYFIGIINGFLIYCTAAGASAIGGGRRRGMARAADSRQAHLPQRDAFKRGFFTSWF